MKGRLNSTIIALVVINALATFVVVWAGVWGWCQVRRKRAF